MKRDMELVRELLFLAESDEDDLELCEKYGTEKVAGHVAILIDAGLVKGSAPEGQHGRPIASQITRLTWVGHEFLDNARNDTVWKNVMAKIKDFASTVSFEILVEMLKTSVLASIQK